MKRNIKSTSTFSLKNSCAPEPRAMNLSCRTINIKKLLLLPLMTAGMAAACLLLGVTATQAQTVVPITSGDSGGGFVPLSIDTGESVDFASKSPNQTIQGVIFAAGTA